MSSTTRVLASDLHATGICATHNYTPSSGSGRIADSGRCAVELAVADLCYSDWWKTWDYSYAADTIKDYAYAFARVRFRGIMWPPSSLCRSHAQAADHVPSNIIANALACRAVLVLTTLSPALGGGGLLAIAMHKVAPLGRAPKQPAGGC